ncbi:MAG TPA: DNA polymerase IV, partial [Thermoanaerobaculia bacterium]|nr:DNA polymerase IV [Thermoanaerobaculia bacterium]
LVAKIASDFGKPDGLTVVPPGRVKEFLEPLPVRRIHGVGPATDRALAELGILTVGDLAQRSQEELAERFGRHGEMLWHFARGEDERPVETSRERKSLGTEHTYSRDLVDVTAMQAELVRLAGEVAAGLAKRGLEARTVAIKVRYGDFTTLTRAHTLPLPTASAAELAREAVSLLATTEVASRPVRLLGVVASGLQDRRASRQLGLFEASDC